MFFISIFMFFLFCNKSIYSVKRKNEISQKHFVVFHAIRIFFNHLWSVSILDMPMFGISAILLKFRGFNIERLSTWNVLMKWFNDYNILFAMLRCNITSPIVYRVFNFSSLALFTFILILYPSVFYFFEISTFARWELS